jgi:predicted secreted Zn-dependent protease
MKRCLALILIVIPPMASQEAVADPSISVRTTYYPIAGTTSAELRSQMKALGPQGYWAYTRWYVRWTGDCRLSVEISYTYPRWTNQDKAPAALRSAWKDMMAHLKSHEEGHGQHGRNAAQEIEKSRCKGDPKSITRKWADQDKVYDAQTNHGRNQGVVLP